jgi:hypothetical protein
MELPEGVLFHVSSVANRASIRQHGLDWRRMGAAPGIAGSPVAEQEGCFLCPDAFTVDFILGLNNTGGPVDVWAVVGVPVEELVESPEGFSYWPRPVPPEWLTLVREDVPAPSRWTSG